MIAFAVCAKDRCLLDKAISANSILPARRDYVRFKAIARFGAPVESDLPLCGAMPLVSTDLRRFSESDRKRLQVHLQNRDQVKSMIAFLPSLTPATWKRLEATQEVALQAWKGEKLSRELRLYPGFEPKTLETYLGLPWEILLTQSQMLSAKRLPTFLAGKFRNIEGMHFSIDARGR